MLMTTLKTLNSPISHAWNVMTKKSSRSEGGNGVSWLDVARVYCMLCVRMDVGGRRVCVCVVWMVDGGWWMVDGEWDVDGIKCGCGCEGCVWMWV